MSSLKPIFQPDIRLNNIFLHLSIIINFRLSFKEMLAFIVMEFYRPAQSIRVFKAVLWYMFAACKWYFGTGELALNYVSSLWVIRTLNENMLHFLKEGNQVFWEVSCLMKLSDFYIYSYKWSLSIFITYAKYTVALVSPKHRF